MSVLKVSVLGERVKYEVAKLTFDKRDLQKAKGWKWEKNGNSLVFTENKLDILKDYETFDSFVAGVAIRHNGEIYYELGDTKGKILNNNVLPAVNHPILIAVRNANKEDGLTQTSATVYDEENTIYEYTIEVSDTKSFDASLLEIITIRCPITEVEHIVEMRYNGKKMKDGIDGLPFGEPIDDKTMYLLTVPKDYANTLGLGESKKLDNLLRFDDFIKEDNQKVGKKSVKKFKTMKDYVKLREDYIHSFINEHERDHEPEEEE